MQIKISKSLESIISRVAFNTVKANITHSHKDYIIVEMLREEGSLAYQLLSLSLKDWELFQVQLRIERELSAVEPHYERSAEGFCRSFAEELFVKYNTSGTISTAHALVAILSDRDTIAAKILEMYGVTSSTVEREISHFTLTAERESSSEHATQSEQLNPASRPVVQPKRAKSKPKKTSLLDKFGVDLTEMARAGEIDPVIGREAQIERMIHILSRRKKNNPILVGEAGVGKSAIVEGLALRIARGDVPHSIQSKRIFSLDISSLVAGTKFRGEFEERLQQLIEELREERDTIIFIDEIHTIVGAGATQGALDTANILKPSLARGELQTIGATTLDEFRNNIESDSALERRFQKVVVEPTSSSETLQILRNIAPSYEEHHNVHYTDEALAACVSLTERYITDREFPDKAIDVMDEAGAEAHLKAGSRNTQKTPHSVTKEDIERVITNITGVPIERVGGGELKRLKALESHLSGRVIGQNEAVSRIARTIRHSRVGLRDANRPIGVFMFVGPTGVGKTLLAKEVSKWLFDQKRGMIRIDMSEYSEKHNVARLIGAPPGYVGYTEGGQLTEAVRRQPYAVILFDEIEKAHPDVFNAMLQIFDEGHLTDGSGRKVDFRNTIIIMTSNVGSRKVATRPQRVGYATTTSVEVEEVTERVEYRKALEAKFAPEFLNRVDDIVLFRSLALEDVERIVDLELSHLRQRTEKLGYTIRVTNGAKRRLASNGYQARYGARALRRTLVDSVEVPLSHLIVDGKLNEGDTIIIESDKRSGVRLRVA